MELVNKPFTMEEYEKEKRERHYKTSILKRALFYIFSTRNQLTDVQSKEGLDLAKDLIKELYGNNNT